MLRHNNLSQLFLKKAAAGRSFTDMDKKTFSIPNISCGHCVMSIKNELGELDGVKTVAGDPETQSIEVEWEAPATEDRIKDTLKEINYPAT